MVVAGTGVHAAAGSSCAQKQLPSEERVAKLQAAAANQAEVCNIAIYTYVYTYVWRGADGTEETWDGFLPTAYF